LNISVSTTSEVSGGISRLSLLDSSIQPLKNIDKTITREREGVTYSLAPDSPRYLMPFAQGILELNSNIVQNPR